MYLRKIIKIRAEDSPNVRFARAQIARGIEPTGEEVLPGVLSWPEYQKRRKLWDPIRQTIGLDAEFYEGAEVLLYPPMWLDRAERLHDLLRTLKVPRAARSMGCDPGEGDADTVWTVVDELGIIDQYAEKTSDTSTITGQTIARMSRFNLLPTQVWFDVGGGGKQHIDRLRQQGYDVNGVPFGGTVSDYDAYKRFHANLKNNLDRKEDVEERYVYKNRRAEMFGILRRLLDVTELPEEIRGEIDDAVILQRIKSRDSIGFAISRDMTELRRQLAPIPLLWDAEGRMYLPPKDKKNKDSEEVTLKELLGRSPDQADSLALAVFGMVTKPLKKVIKPF